MTGLRVVVAVAFLSLLLPASPALSQAGSAGGTIGKHGKSVSGGEEPAKPAKPSRTRSTEEGGTRKKTASHCPNIVGTWNSWASGLFGSGDTTFSKDGTATHRSGIVGKWFCEKGKLHIEWPDAKPGIVTMSDDGKRLITSDGNVHMSRD